MSKVKKQQNKSYPRELFDAVRRITNYSIHSKVIFKKTINENHSELLEIYKISEILEVYDIVESHTNKEDRDQEKKLLLKKPLIVPPGLNPAILDFKSHYAVAGDYPIMILGPTGVGKSLFLYLAKQFFKKEHQYDQNPPKIVEANCAHFSGGGEGHSLARTELFGYVEGAFTGAKKNKDGLVKAADGGLLILEEVGELPKEVQAMLLTFIETGKYRRLGDNKEETAKIKLVAATNRESALRDDFRYRFFPYYIPPLHERKEDILYYFKEIFPELTKKFSKSEVLLLLAHNWPGNVREVERVGRLLMRLRRSWRTEDVEAGKSYPLERIFHLDPHDTSFNPDILNSFNKLMNSHVDQACLENLPETRISLNREDTEPAFKELTNASSDYFSWFDENTLKFCNIFEPFMEAYTGYVHFCEMNGQNDSKDLNILESIIKERTDEKIGQEKARITTVDNSGTKDGRCSSEDEAIKVLLNLTEDELVKLYYENQLNKSRGNVKTAAKRVGLNYSTFRDRLKKQGVEFGRQPTT